MGAHKIILDKPGIYDISEELYHRDPCLAPSASSSILRVIATRTPRHAWYAHPRLNPAHRAIERGDFDIGKAAHALLLEGEDRMAIVEAGDWRTKEAKAARDSARARGKLPLLRKDYDAVKEMVAAAWFQIGAHEITPMLVSADGKQLTFGAAEQTLIWEDAGLWCRVRPDSLDQGQQTIYDYKTTAGSADPDTWSRNHLWPGFAIQEAWYKRGVRRVLKWPDPQFRFIVQETKPPYALSVVELDPAAQDLARRMMEGAWNLWRRCMQTDQWPGYPGRVAHVAAPGFVAYQHDEREERDRALSAGGDDIFKIMNKWQAPLGQEASS